MPTSPSPAPVPSVAAIAADFSQALAHARRDDDPFRHWTLSGLFPADVLSALGALPFPVPDLEGVSGARELHNNTRRYFDPETNQRHAVCGAVAEAFQDGAVAGAIAEATGAQIDDCFLRIEYAQDADGFWLKPHTDLGVKKLTMLVYLADQAGQEDLGTDIYRPDQSWAKRSAFEPNSALLFVPSDDTWHGFERRTISGVRKTVIVNYVTQDWRAREQLAYPDRTVRV